MRRKELEDENVDLFNIFMQSHKGSWAILVLAFLLTCIFQRQKITPIILRIFYLIMLISGIGMLVQLKFPLLYSIKGILAVLMIGVMEMICGRLRRNQPTGMFWVIFIILLGLIVSMGFGYLTF